MRGKSFHNEERESPELCIHNESQRKTPGCLPRKSQEVVLTEIKHHLQFAKTTGYRETLYRYRLRALQ